MGMIARKSGDVPQCQELAKRLTEIEQCARNISNSKYEAG